MSQTAIRLGYVLLYVKEVESAMEFYHKAFGFAKKFVAPTKNYGEVETGATRLGFVSYQLAQESFPLGVVQAKLDGPPLGCEIGIVCNDVAALFDAAVKAGARVMSEPTVKPWGQTVAYVRDPEGHFVELCSPLP